jgi:uncharacterized membrane protein
MKALQKTITFRILATIATACVAWYATGNYNVGATIGVGTAITNSTLYYIHEKMWEDKSTKNTNI